MTQPLSGKKYGYSVCKSFADKIVAALLLIAFSPLWLLLVGISWLFLDGKMGFIFFAQVRPGHQGRPFLLLKMRTLDSKGAVSSSWAGFLRRSGLDEWPQLINVLKGEMSFVGPRPLLMQYLPLYSEKERLRMAVKPGITGLAQTKGRNLTTWQERFYWDAVYVREMTFGLDLAILLKTARQLLFRKGNTQEMAVWDGSTSGGE